MTTTTDTQACLEYSHLISDRTASRLINRMVKDHGLEEAEATIILDGALGYLQMVGTMPEAGRLGPSELVDIGWHTFLLYTVEYAEFCKQVAGHFIHHVPDDNGEPMGLPLMSTVEFMDNHGIAYNPLLWTNVGHPCAKCNDKTDCGRCCNGGGPEKAKAGCVGQGGGGNCGTQVIEAKDAVCSDGHSCQSRSCGTKITEATAQTITGCNGGGSGGGNCTGCRTCGPQ